jgi:hypothetical protein
MEIYNFFTNTGILLPIWVECIFFLVIGFLYREYKDKKEKERKAEDLINRIVGANSLSEFGKLSTSQKDIVRLFARHSRCTKSKLTWKGFKSETYYRSMCHSPETNWLRSYNRHELFSLVKVLVKKGWLEQGGTCEDEFGIRLTPQAIFYLHQNHES